MDFELEKKFTDAIAPLTALIGEKPDLQSVLFLIGAQELGQGVRSFKKDEKLNVMHIAVCTVLEPYGYYAFDGDDEQGWPHFRLLKKLPPLNQKEQETFMKKAVIEYFESLQLKKPEA